MKECMMNKIKNIISPKCLTIVASSTVGAIIGTIVGLGINIKISRKITPIKKGTSIALGALGEMMTSISKSL